MKKKKNEPEIDPKDQVWKIYMELGQFERHFSSHQATMRTLASTWLLASFAGIGFAISEKIQIAIPVQIMICGIGILTVTGLCLLWILDLRVYQQLLDAAYIVGKKLEEKYDWLPPVRVTMRKLLKGKGVYYSRLYYIVAMIVMLIISLGGLSHWLVVTQNTLMLVFSVLIYVVGGYILSKIMVRESPATKQSESNIAFGDLIQQ